MTTTALTRRTLGPLALTFAICPALASGQTLRLTLDEAIRIATDHSETVAAARAGEARAAADLTYASSFRLPQVAFGAGYDRTLASEFGDVFSATSCAPVSVDATQPVGARLDELERAASCGSLGQSFDLATLPFGQRNAIRFTFSFSQALYTGGRVQAQRRVAEHHRQAAAIETTTAEAALALVVADAFYGAALTDRLLAIAESALAQATSAYDQTRLAFEAGRQPEFELLRAQVTRDNHRPVVIRRRSERDVAYLRLRQLLELPDGTPLDLSVDLDAAELPAPFPAAPEAEFAIDDHAGVRQAQADVQAREAGIAAARAEGRPTVSFESAYSRIGYPPDGRVPEWSDFRTNWIMGAAFQMPLFTGLRVRAGVRAAEADLDVAEARLRLARETVELDRATARQNAAAAEAVWQASAGTVQQARRAYEIAELRYREGLSTQLELSDARLALQLAEANRAQAARDLQVARAHVALLPNLPAGVNR